MKNNYLVGQRVLLNKTEIGTVVKPENNYSTGVWVHSPSRGYASCYDVINIKPLPHGQV